MRTAHGPWRSTYHNITSIPYPVCLLFLLDMRGTLNFSPGSYRRNSPRRHRAGHRVLRLGSPAALTSFQQEISSPRASSTFSSFVKQIFSTEFNIVHTHSSKRREMINSPPRIRPPSAINLKDEGRNETSMFSVRRFGPAFDEIQPGSLSRVRLDRTLVYRAISCILDGPGP